MINLCDSKYMVYPVNVHPLLVHFPLTFFITYAIFELIPFKKITKQPFWFYIKAILVFLGVVSAFVAGIAGKIIQPQFAEKTLVSIHEHVNESATAIFAIIAFSYLIAWLQQDNNKQYKQKFGKFWSIALKIGGIVLHTWLIYVLALIGLVLIMLGGTLGGIIVYGPNLDPITSFVYSLLIASGVLK